MARTKLREELACLGLSDAQIAKLEREVCSVFVGENDFSSSLELFLHFRIGEVKT